MMFTRINCLTSRLVIIIFSSLLTYSIARALFVNRLIYGLLGEASYYNYQILYFVVLCLLFSARLIPKNTLGKGGILYGLLAGYLSSIFSYLYSEMLRIDGYERFINTFVHHFNDDSNIWMTFLLFPVVLMGWLIGSLMGFVILFLDKNINQCSKRRMG